MKRTVIIIGIIIIIGMIYFAGAKEGFQQPVLMTGINIIATLYEISTYIIILKVPPGTVIKNTTTNTVVWTTGDPPVSSMDINKYILILPEGGRINKDQLPSFFASIEAMFKKGITYPGTQISIQLSTGEEYPSKITYTPSNPDPIIVIPTENSVPSSFPVKATGFNVIISPVDFITFLNKLGPISLPAIDVATNQQVDITKSTTDTNLRKYFIPAPQESSDTIITDLNMFNQTLNDIKQLFSLTLSKNVSVSIQTSDGEYPPLALPTNGGSEYNPIDCQMGQLLRSIKNNLTKMV